jgi:hypothetical protein
MNFKPTLVKTLVATIVAFLAGKLFFDITKICTYGDCGWTFWGGFVPSLALGLSIATFLYGLWSILQKNVRPASVRQKWAGALVVVICSLILLYVWNIFSFKIKL